MRKVGKRHIIGIKDSVKHLIGIEEYAHKIGVRPPIDPDIALIAPENFSIETFETNEFSLLFNGTSDYVDATVLTGLDLNRFSISFYMKSNSTDHAQILGTTNDGDNTAFIFDINLDASASFIPGQVRFFLRDQDNTTLRASLEEPFDFNDNQWHKIDVRRSGDNTVQIFIDADEKIVTYTVQQNPDNFAVFQYPFFIGANNNRGSAANHFPGLMDDVRIWNDGIKEVEFAHWKFDEGSGTTAFDSVGSNNATINGATYSEDVPFSEIITRSTWNEVAGIDGYNVYLKQKNYSLQFDGIDDYVNLSPLAGLNLNDFKISFYHKRSSTESEYIFGFFNDGSTTGIQIGVNNDSTGAGVPGIVRIYIRDETAALLSGEISDVVNFNDNEWHFFEVSRTGLNTLEIKIDGVVQGITYAAQESPSNYVVPAYNPAFHSVNVRGTHSIFASGFSDDLQIYSGISLIAHWKFDEGFGTTALDSIGGNDGTINGAVYSEDVPEVYEFEKQNELIIEALQFDITDLLKGQYEAHATSVREEEESEPSNIVGFTIQ